MMIGKSEHDEVVDIREKAWPYQGVNVANILLHEAQLATRSRSS